MDGDFFLNNHVAGRFIIDEATQIGGDLTVTGNVDFGIFVAGWDPDTNDRIFTPYTPDAFPDLVQGTVTISAQDVKVIEDWQDNGFNADLRGGNGGLGITAGGNGGSISKSALYTNTTDLSAGATNDLTWSFIAGSGGAGTGASSKGGLGGSISDVDFGGNARGSFDKFEVKAGNGGNAEMAGGAGGSLINIDGFLNDPVLNGTAFGAGDGGDGANAKSLGGAGGSILGSVVNTSWNSSGDMPPPVSILAGHGGDGGAVGGIGGSIKSGEFRGLGLDIHAGNGGVSPLAGGMGGSVSANLVGFADGGLNLMAGDGAAGGGHVEKLKIEQSFAPATIAAGNALDGTKPANGGAVRDVEINFWNIESGITRDISITAGAGAMGGHGGNIENIHDQVWGWQDDSTLYPSPVNLDLQAGAGSEGIKTGGNGGSIKGVKLVGPADSSTYSFQAGDAGGGEKGGNGGTVENVALLTTTTVHQSLWIGNRHVDKPFKASFGPDVTLGNVDISTGMGGQSSTVAILGGKGGDAKSIAWNTLNVDALARTLTLGLGGDGNDTRGPNGKAIGVNPDPNFVASSFMYGATTTTEAPGLFKDVPSSGGTLVLAGYEPGNLILAPGGTIMFGPATDSFGAWSLASFDLGYLLGDIDPSNVIVIRDPGGSITITYPTPVS